MKGDPAEKIKEEKGGVQAAISVAVTKKAFEQAYHTHIPVYAVKNIFDFCRQLFSSFLIHRFFQ